MQNRGVMAPLNAMTHEPMIIGRSCPPGTITIKSAVAKLRFQGSQASQNNTAA